MAETKPNRESTSHHKKPMSARRASEPRIPRKEKRSSFGNLLLHIHPRTLPEQTLKLSHTWGLGGAAFLMVLLQIITGMLLLFVFQAVPDKAYDSVRILLNQVLFGRFIRNIHFWSANLLVTVVLLHMLRVFFTGAFHAPRRFNWVIGICLFGFVLVSNFTGYLLPWDQLAYWAVTICTGMMEYIPWIGPTLQKIVRGGITVGPATLSNFFVFHVIVMPICFLLFLPFHFWRIRKAGGVIHPRTIGQKNAAPEDLVPAMPTLVTREVSFGLVVIAVIFLLAAVFDAPLGDPANPGLSPNPTKAPWYFMGQQELILHFHPLFAAFIIPVALTGLVISLPYMRCDSDMSGIWFRSRRGRRTALLSALTALCTTPLAIIVDEFYLDFESWLPGVSPVISNGLLPTLLIVFILTGLYTLVKRKFTDSNNEAIQALFVFLLVVFIVFTAFGIWFRGPGMAVCW